MKYDSQNLFVNIVDNEYVFDLPRDIYTEKSEAEAAQSLGEKTVTLAIAADRMAARLVKRFLKGVL